MVTSRVMDGQERWYADNLPLKGAVVADVGANVGRLSESFWTEVGPSGRVVSIEPLAEHVQTIAARIADRKAPSWTVEACAVSDRYGELELEPFRDPEHGLNSVVVSTPGSGRIRVACRRLVELVPDATVVKLDIEGHEYTVLDDSLPVMPNVSAWAIEFHFVPHRPLQATLSQLVSAGYALFAAGRPRQDPTGPWQSFAIPATLTWDSIPVAKVHADGTVFKMLHVIARRP